MNGYTSAPKILALALALTGCGDASTRQQKERVHDLVAELAAAEVTADAAGKELLTESARLGRGWAPPESDDRRRRTFRWVLGGEAELEMTLLARRELVLVLEARPFLFPGSGVQRVAISWNGVEAGEVELPRRLAEHRLALPAEATRAGTNRLRLAFAYQEKPSRVVAGSSDERELAAAVYGLKLESSARGGDAPRVDLESGRVALPFGVQVDYYLEVREASELVVEDWTIRGSGRLDVLWQSEGSDEELLTSVRAAAAPRRLALPDPGAARLARLRLRALGDGDGAVVLLRPAVLAPRTGEDVPVATAGETPSPERGDILIYMIDTLRADRLGCYGHPGGLTPEIDAFAAGAVVYERSIAQSSWTKSSVASLLTGLWPPEHAALKRNHRLSDEALTLPEILAEAGYATAAFVTNPNVTATFGFDQGFEEFTDLGIEARADEVTEAVLGYLDRRTDERPFFLYVHTLDPHDPYDPPANERRRHAPQVEAGTLAMHKVLNDLQAGRREVKPRLVSQLASLYAAEIAANDRSFGVLVEGLKSRGLYDDAWLAVVSDHGEELYEHGHFRHGKALFVESLRVPLILKAPGMKQGRRVSEPVQHTDLLPTLLDALGLPRPDALRGRNLLAPLAPTPIYSYLHLDGPPRLSVAFDGWKLIQRREGGGLTAPRLFELGSDPGEQNDLAARNDIRRGYLATLLRRRLLGGVQDLEAEEVVLDEELRRNLEALGYLDP